MSNTYVESNTSDKVTCCQVSDSLINYASPKEGEVCVDLGTNNEGKHAILCSKQMGGNGTVHAVYHSMIELDKAKLNIEKSGMKNIAVYQSDWNSIPLADNFADVLIANCSIKNALDKDRVWAEIFRVLRPGGRFVVNDIYTERSVSNESGSELCYSNTVTKQKYIHDIVMNCFTDIDILEEDNPIIKDDVKIIRILLKGSKPLW